MQLFRQGHSQCVFQRLLPMIVFSVEGTYIIVCFGKHVQCRTIRRSQKQDISLLWSNHKGLEQRLVPGVPVQPHPDLRMHVKGLSEKCYFLHPSRFQCFIQPPLTSIVDNHILNHSVLWWNQSRLALTYRKVVFRAFECHLNGCSGCCSKMLVMEETKG